MEELAHTYANLDSALNPVAMTIINPWKEYWLSWGMETATSCSEVLYRLSWVGIFMGSFVTLDNKYMYRVMYLLNETLS